MRKRQRLSISQEPLNSFDAHLSAALGKTRAGAEPRSRVYLAAVSGGADSTAMLAGLAVLRGGTPVRVPGFGAGLPEGAGFVLHCVHVEHGIRPADESQGDAQAVKTLCERLKVPCRVISIPPGRIVSYASKSGAGIEAAARFFRHKALRTERRRVKADWILTAHTRDDLLETLLMRVLRGSGPAGLVPMPRTRGRLLRPLLDVSRQDVLAYLEEKGIPYRTDSTNADIAFLRNRVRLKLAPVLDSFFPSWRNSLLSLAETQALTAEFLASEARKRLPWESDFSLEESSPGNNSFRSGLRLRETDFFNAPPVLREEAVFAGADTLAARKGLKNTRVPRRAAVRTGTGAGVATGAVEDLGPVRLVRRNGYVYLTPKDRRMGEKGFSLLIKEEGLYTLKASVLGGKIPDLCIQAEYPAGVSGTAFAFSGFPLVFRNHRQGDCIFRGGRKRRFSDILDRDVRSSYTGIITACDAEGPAAFIGIGKDLMVVNRDASAVRALTTCVLYFAQGNFRG